MAKFGEVSEPLTLTKVRWERRAVEASTFRFYQPPHDDVGWLWSASTR